MNEKGGRTHRRILAMLLPVALWGWLATGCDNAMLPTSTGKPYEALVVAADTLAADIVRQVLGVPMSGLPQDEPLFDVTYCNSGKFGYAQRLMRSIVIVDIDSNRHDKVEIRFERNKHSAPQMIVYLNTPGRKALQEAMRQSSTRARLTALLLTHEEGIQTALIDEHRNTMMEQTVREMFGIDIHIPANMQASKTDKGFLWCADNGGSSMQGLCIFEGTQADSILKKHVIGEKDGMYMVLQGARGTFHLSPFTFKRGLWEMKGDAMGGPYVMKTLTTRQPTPVTLLGFVYAPGHEKRIMVRRLEAIINSATTARNEEQVNNK